MAVISSVILKSGVIILTVPVTLAVITLITSWWKPFRRGFFCDDESIQLPNLGSTVPSDDMYAVGLTIPVLLILYCEYIHYKKYDIERYYRSAFRKVVCFALGFAFEYLTVTVGKLTTCRLRPNFIAVCGIDLDRVCQNDTHRYVSDYVCPNGEDVVSDSRISFPSGHSAFSFYAAVFTVIYLQKRFKLGTSFWRPLVQICILVLAWWVSMTRIMDNQHHFSDVIVGIVIGISIGVLNTIFIHSLDEDEEADFNSSSKGSSLEASKSENRHLLQDEESNK